MPTGRHLTAFPTKSNTDVLPTAIRKPIGNIRQKTFHIAISISPDHYLTLHSKKSFHVVTAVLLLPLKIDVKTVKNKTKNKTMKTKQKLSFNGNRCQSSTVI